MVCDTVVKQIIVYQIKFRRKRKHVNKENRNITTKPTPKSKLKRWLFLKKMP